MPRRTMGMSDSSKSRRRLPRPTYANVASTLALIVACSGTAAAIAPALADHSVAARNIQRDAIRSQHIAANAVRDRHVRPGEIGAAKIRGLVTRERGPLPVGVHVQAHAQAAQGPFLAIVKVVGPLASPQTYPGYRPHLIISFGGAANGVISTTGTAQVTCPAGTVVHATGIAVSQPTGTVSGTFVRTLPPVGSFPGTWVFSVSPDSASADQDSQTVTVSANFVGQFQSPPAGGGQGQWLGNGKPFIGWQDPTELSPGINAPAPPPGAGVQAIAYCLQIVPGA